MFKAHPPKTKTSSRFLLQRHPGGNANASHGEATHSQVPRDGRRPSVHDHPDLPCEASRIAKMGRAGPTGTCTPKRLPPGGETRWGTERPRAPTLGASVVISPVGRQGGEGGPQRWTAGAGQGGPGEADRRDKKQKKRGGRARIWTECRVRGKGEGVGP